MPINELRAIATFIKAAELGSLRQAALAQGLSPQAASQALAQLESHLGVRLFHRTTRQLSLTDEGQQFLETAQPSLAGLQRALQLARRAKDDIAGPLRIVGPRSSFRAVLWPLVDAFCRQHPAVQPDLQLDDRLGNWVEDRVDVGFRIGVAADDGVIARRLFTLQLIACASPDYLRRHGAPEHIDALMQHRCCTFRHPVTGRLLPWHFKVDGAPTELHVLPAISTNEEGLEVEAALTGQAIGQLTGVTAAEHIRSGRLVPLLTANVADHLALFVYYGSRAAQPARARAFIDLAIERLTDAPDFVLTPRELVAAEAKGRKAYRPPGVDTR
jgi:DNA-binding transcriptional LysR family regulator